jgi:nucleotide-binding universal stress UspA family protein
MYKHILIATDGSELAGKGVEAGLALGKRLGTKVTAVTAIEPWLSIEQRHSSGFHGVPESG